MPLLTLLPPTALGEHACRMRGPADGGREWFVHDRWPEGVVSRIDVDVDVPARRFTRVDPDFLATSAGVPLLSARFVQNLENAVLDDVDLIPARLHLEGGSADFQALRIRTTRPLVDADRSGFFESSSGVRALTRLVLREVPDDFLFARDEEFRSRWVASPRIGDLVEDRRLRVETVPAAGRR